ncbi:YceD family protein [Corynebacterium mendelii]|uniref:DUF177 domain-containing protein n=1 Tax=Corynebacterium mendelii TaxID=2765362 RepID=A0A939IUF8_9CORY|nr:YceD family protein [Corynebacterium mendelii]MBN9643146.1 DUF177 domain-containing protein [Corynebacterium mendelii]
MSSPFVFDVQGLLTSHAETVHRTHHGSAPTRIGGAMVAVEQGAAVTVEATLTPLGGAVMVDATVSAPMTGQCCRCLAPINAEKSFDVNEVFTEPGTITIGGEQAADDDDETDPEEKLIVDESVDMEQSVIDTVVLELPFSPVCADFGQQCDNSPQAAPVADGISGDKDNDLPDPRWAGLEKFR